jgi:hypothetical protein
LNGGIGSPSCVALPIDYSENTRVLVDELRARLAVTEPD